MVKLNKIYTRTGDDGTTGLVDGSRIPKDTPRMAAIGDVDEANSAIGLARAAPGCGDFPAIAATLARIQNELFDLGADIATPKPESGEDEAHTLRIAASQVAAIEADIDALNASLEPLKSFILPAGTPFSAALHLARAVARRAERAMVAASRDAALNPHALAYANRLSDWLFVAARAANARDGEVLWQPGATR